MDARDGLMDLTDLLADDEIDILERYRELCVVSDRMFALCSGLGLAICVLAVGAYLRLSGSAATTGEDSSRADPLVVVFTAIVFSVLAAWLIARRVLRGHLTRRRQELDVLRAQPEFQATVRKVYALTRDPEEIDDESGYASLVLRDRHLDHLFT